MINNLQHYVSDGDGESTTGLPEQLRRGIYSPDYPHTVTRTKKLSTDIRLIKKYSIDDIIEEQWTSTVDPVEVFPMENIRNDITELKVSVAELNKDVKHISEKIEPIPKIATDLAVIKDRHWILILLLLGIFGAAVAQLFV